MSKQIDHLVVLCGGKGTRLHSVLPDTPKALVVVNGKPFLEHLLNFAEQSGFTTVTLACGHMSDAITTFVTNRLNAGDSPSVEILIEKESTPMGTGGAILRILECLPSQFAVCNADTLFDFSTEHALQWFANSDNTCAVIAFKSDKIQVDAGRLLVNSRGQVTRFIEKSDIATQATTYINSGFYFFTRKLLKRFETRPCSLELEILPELAKQGDLYCYHQGVNAFHDYGTVDRYEKLKDRNITNMEMVNDRH